MYLKINKCLASLIVIFILTCHPPAFALNDAIIAVVNDEVITLKNLSDYLRASYLQLRSEGKSEEEIEQIIAELEQRGLEKLIEDRLIIQAAKKAGMEIRPRLIDERIEEIRKRYPSEKAFIEALTAEGLSITDLRTKINEQYLIQFMADMEVRSKIFVNPQEVTEYYAENKDEFKRPLRLNLDSIFIKYKSDQKEERQRAKEAYAKLKQGADFREVAKEYSDTPGIGIIKKGDLLPNLEEAIFKLAVEEITPPLETDNGIFIFKLLGKIPEEIPPIEKVKTEITDRVFQMKFRERFLRWLDKLKQEAYVEIKD